MTACEQVIHLGIYNVIRRLFGCHKWESVSALLLSLGRLNVRYLLMLLLILYKSVSLSVLLPNVANKRVHITNTKVNSALHPSGVGKSSRIHVYVLLAAWGVFRDVLHVLVFCYGTSAFYEMIRCSGVPFGCSGLLIWRHVLSVADTRCFLLCADNVLAGMLELDVQWCIGSCRCRYHKGDHQGGNKTQI